MLRPTRCWWANGEDPADIPTDHELALAQQLCGYTDKSSIVPARAIPNSPRAEDDSVNAKRQNSS